MAGIRAVEIASGAQVRAARALLDMSQADLALAAGITRVTLTTLESGRRVSYDATLQRVVAALQQRGIVFLNGETGTGVLLQRHADVSSPDDTGD